MDMRLCTNSKRILWQTVGYDGLRKGSYGVVGMGGFEVRDRIFDLIHSFHSAYCNFNFHRSKDNVQPPFLNAFAPVSLLYNLPFPKNIGLASVLQQPFRTGSKHPKKRVAPHTGVGTRAGNVTKKLFCRVLNRSPGVERAAALRLLPVLFVEAKRT